jgi:ATP/maltotriose-dependent transcriptional regulator MalT
VELREGNTPRARELLGESQTVALELSDRRLLAAASNARAHIALYQGDYEGAKLGFEDALQQFRAADDAGGVKFALTSLGLVALQQGRFTDAAWLFRESLSIRVEFTRSSADDAIDGCAAIAIARGDASTAARLLGATEEWRRAVGYGKEPFESAIRARTAAAARKALGDDLYEKLTQEGRAIDLDAAIELALTTLD